MAGKGDARADVFPRCYSSVQRVLVFCAHASGPPLLWPVNWLLASIDYVEKSSVWAINLPFSFKFFNDRESF
jgi:hypothetical protein